MNAGQQPNKIEAAIGVRGLGDAGAGPRLAERAALMTCAGRRDIDLLTGEPGIGKNTVCRQVADSLHDDVHQVRCVSRFRPAARSSGFTPCAMPSSAWPSANLNLRTW